MMQNCGSQELVCDWLPICLSNARCLLDIMAVFLSLTSHVIKDLPEQSSVSSDMIGPQVSPEVRFRVMVIMILI